MGSHARRIVALLVAIPVVACAGSGIWTSTGPYGGLTYDLVIDPATPSNLYATSRGGVFRSSDGGTSWQRAQSGIIGSVSWDYPLMMDGDRPQRLYSVDTSGRLYRSTDGALNWNPTGYVLPPTEGAWRLADKPGAGTEGVFILATQNGGNPLAAPGLLRTVDDGATMVRMGGGLPNTGFIAVAFDPSDGNRVLAGTDYRFDLAPADPSIPALWRSTDGGDTWTAVYTEAATGFTQRVEAIAWGAGSTAYAVVDCSLLRSADDGATWTFVSFNCFSTLAAHPAIANTVYAGGNSGLQVSTDGGATFAPSPTTLTPNPTYTDTLGRPIPAYVRRVVLDPTFPAAGAPIWAVTEGGGLFRSLDGAATFSNSGVNDGLSAANVRALAVHPSTLYTATGSNPNRPIYAGFGDSFYGSPALWRSVNNGATWPTSNTNLKGSNIRSIAFDPTTVGGVDQVNNASPTLATGIVYAVGRSALNGVNAQYRNSGVYKSTNGGGNWNMLDGGMPRSGVAPNDFANIGTLRGVLVDPRSCANPPPGNARCGTDLLVTTGQSPANTIWIAGSGRGALGWRVARSTDGGANWASRDNGIPVPSVDGQILTPIILAMDPADSNTLYLSTTISFDYTVDPVPTIANGVFKTTDGGANWVPANGPAGTGGLPRYPGSTDTALDVLAMAVHPVDAGKLWVSTIRFNTPLGFADTGLYRSADGGNTWISSSSGIPAGIDIRALIIDRTNPQVLYASGAGSEANPGAVYKSDNGGDTWRSISVGLPADSALALALDPVDTRLIHAGTNLGIWDLTQVPDDDGDGASNNTESVSPSPGGGGTGDGNGDGTPDALQGDVGSSIVLDAPQWEGRLGSDTQALLDAAPQGGALSFTTDIQGTACLQATDVQGVAAAAYGRDYLSGNSGRFYDYPRDLVRFEIPNCGAAVVDITFHNITFNGRPDFNDYQWSFRFRGPQVPGQDATIGWYDLGARAQKLSGTKWRITLDANQFGSYRPVDDSILFMGGPAFSNDRVFRSGFE